MKMIKLFEAFCGYGGASHSLKLANIEFQTVGISEIDKYAIQCYNQNFPNVKNYGDITKIDWTEVPDFDLLTGGFPCQSFSVAGKQLGADDLRGQLGLELTKALHYKKPKYFLFENVKGFMSKKFESFREYMINSWKKEGYQVIYKILNTKDYGIPQNRERIFFIGIRNDIYEPFKFRWPEPEILTLRLKDMLELEVDMKYYLKEEQTKKLLASTRHTSALQDKDNSYTLCARDYKEPKAIDESELIGKKVKDYGTASRVLDKEGLSPTLRGAMGEGGNTINLISCAIRQRDRHNKQEEKVQQLEIGKEYANSITSVQKDSMIIQINNPPHSNDRVYNSEGLSPTLNSMQGGNRQPFITHSLYPRSSKNGNGGSGHLTKQDDTSYCVDTGNMQAIEVNYRHHFDGFKGYDDLSPSIKSSEGSGNQIIINNIRRLTPTECFRLQGFYNFDINLDGISDSQKYKLAGNGWSINVVSKILRNLLC